MEQIIPNPRIKFNKSIGALDYNVLMHDQTYKFYNDYECIVSKYDYYNSHKYQFYNALDSNDNLSVKKYDSYIYQQIKKKLLELPYSKDEIVDTLVYFLYTYRKSSSKKTLWECFGKEIYDNIKNNTTDMGNICPICGARIEDVDNVEKKYCSQECADVAKREYWREYKHKQNSFFQL